MREREREFLRQRVIDLSTTSFPATSREFVFLFPFFLSLFLKIHLISSTRSRTPFVETNRIRNELMSSFLISWCEIEETDSIRKDTFPSPLCPRLPCSKNVQTHWNVSIRERARSKEIESQRKSKRLLCDIYPDSFACLLSSHVHSDSDSEIFLCYKICLRRSRGRDEVLVDAWLSWTGRFLDILLEHREENLSCGIYWTFSEKRRKRSDQSRFAAFSERKIPVCR